MPTVENTKVSNTISSKHSHGDAPSKALLAHRDMLAFQFSSHFEDLLTGKIPYQESSKKGRLNPSRVYRHNFDDQIFNIKESIPDSNTTIVAAIDASGSMNTVALGTKFTQIQLASSIISAFAKANREVCDDKIRLEVFLKTGVHANMTTTPGIKDNPCFITRIYSNRADTELDPDSIFGWSCKVPMGNSKGMSYGSITPEYAVLPALFEWMEDNITDNNKVFINLTDGEPWYNSAASASITLKDIGTMRNKYLFDTDDINIFLNHRPSLHDLAYYGERNLIANSSTFTPQMFELLSGIMDEAL